MENNAKEHDADPQDGHDRYAIEKFLWLRQSNDSCKFASQQTHEKDISERKKVPAGINSLRKILMKRSGKKDDGAWHWQARNAAGQTRLGNAESKKAGWDIRPFCFQRCSQSLYLNTFTHGCN